MWLLGVVVIGPFLSDGSDLIQGFKDVCIQDMSSVQTVEAFDVSVLCWFSRLDIL